MIPAIDTNLGKIFPIVAAVILIFCLFGCETPSEQNTSEAEKPGLYNLHGWDYKSYHAYNNQADDADIDGKIGYPLTVGYPTARAVPGGNWTYNYEILS